MMDEEDIEEITNRAWASLKKRERPGIRGQLISQADSIEWHVVNETVKYIKEKNQREFREYFEGVASSPI